MHLEIIGKQIKVTASLNDHIKENLKRIKCYFDKIIHVYVSLEVIKNTQIAELTVTVDRHHFHNRVKSDDMYKSIDMLFHKMERQVRRYKEYLIDRKQSGFDGHSMEIKLQQEEKKIKIHEQKIANKPMNDLEVVLQMSLDENVKSVGYYADIKEYKNNHPNFVYKINNTNYKIYHFDLFWEEKSVILTNEKKLEISSIQSIKPPIETIEDSLDYMQNNDIDFRLFISLRLQKPILITKISKEYYLIREEL